MATPPEVVRTIVAYQGQVAQTRERVALHADRAWGSLRSWRDEDIDRFVRVIVPVSLGAQQRIAALTDAYLTAVGTAAGVRVRPSGTPAGLVTGERLRGVAPAEVYRRSGVTVWTALSEGKSLTDAVDMGAQRLQSLLATDLQLAKTRTARSYMGRDATIQGYRRVLTGRENCALCVIASTQRYHKGDLLPIHPGCDCDVAPIRGGVDPGQVIDPDRLEQLHQAAADQLGAADASGRAPDYRHIEVRDHGEYGPTLTWRGQHFDGPADVAS